MPYKKNHYQTLGIPPEAGEREIRTAYRNLAKKYHPDAGEGSSAERFRDVQEAYDLLSDAEKRMDYDCARAEESRRPVRTATAYSTHRSPHLDLRDVMRKRTDVVVEPAVEWPPGSRDAVDPWEELLEFLFRGF